MSLAWTIAVKALAGGAFVVLFALVGEVLRPQRLAGLFSAAPSVALAGLIVALSTKGLASARAESAGMVVGGVAMVAACASAIYLVHRFRALRGAILACVLWLVVAIAGYEVFLR